MCDYQKFLYVLVKEYSKKSENNKLDNSLRIVYWPKDDVYGYDEHFVIYGKRSKTKKYGKFVPYRLKCNSIENVYQFVKSVVSFDNYFAVELHQFDGLTDDSHDWYNLDWCNTPENPTTELVAYDIDPNTNLRELYMLLDVLVANEVV